MKVTVEDVPQVKLGTKGVLIRIRDGQGKNLWKVVDRIGQCPLGTRKRAREEREETLGQGVRQLPERSIARLPSLRVQAHSHEFRTRSGLGSNPTFRTVLWPGQTVKTGDCLLDLRSTAVRLIRRPSGHHLLVLRPGCGLPV